TTPPALSKAQILTNVLSLTNLFSTCVEAFNLIHPSKDSSRVQKVALAKLGIQQGRLLIWGDVVGISSPPQKIARHMIPSHPGATNPDPNLPVNFGVRDERLDDEGLNHKVRDALNQIAGRPSHLSREELMEKFGLKSPKRFSSLEYPALDTNRLEAFREKYALLQDLVRSSGARASLKRGMSMTAQHWTVQDSEKFEAFVKTARLEVDGLVALFGVKEQVDKGMKTDIRAMGWHPDLSGPIVRQDWEKLKLVREACVQDYPEYVEVTDKALKYISEELRGTHLESLRRTYEAELPIRTKPEGENVKKEVPNGAKTPDKEKRPGFLSHFRLKSWTKSSRGGQARSKSISSSSDNQDPQRSLSADLAREDDNKLEPVRSKSLSAIPDDHAPFNLDSRLEGVTTNDSEANGGKLETVNTVDTVESNQLVHANTANSLIDRHDMYKGVGRIETKDIRGRAHD
ncbi:prion-inhibition and propagation-domain-containing protein, partial [Clohesyomyces aquaticus]